MEIKKINPNWGNMVHSIEDHIYTLRNHGSSIGIGAGNSLVLEILDQINEKLKQQQSDIDWLKDQFPEDEE